MSKELEERQVIALESIARSAATLEYMMLAVLAGFGRFGIKVPRGEELAKASELLAQDIRELREQIARAAK